MTCINPNRVPLNSDPSLPLRYEPEPNGRPDPYRHVQRWDRQPGTHKTLWGGVVGDGVLALLERLPARSQCKLPPIWSPHYYRALDKATTFVVVHRGVVVGEFATFEEGEAAMYICAKYIQDEHLGLARYDSSEVRRAA
jgi:hypothetical protein